MGGEHSSKRNGMSRSVDHEVFLGIEANHLPLNMKQIQIEGRVVKKIWWKKFVVAKFFKRSLPARPQLIYI